MQIKNEGMDKYVFLYSYGISFILMYVTLVVWEMQCHCKNCLSTSEDQEIRISILQSTGGL